MLIIKVNFRVVFICCNIIFSSFILLWALNLDLFSSSWALVKWGVFTWRFIDSSLNLHFCLKLMLSLKLFLVNIVSIFYLFTVVLKFSFSDSSLYELLLIAKLILKGVSRDFMFPLFISNESLLDYLNYAECMFIKLSFPKLSFINWLILIKVTVRIQFYQLESGKLKLRSSCNYRSIFLSEL